MSPGMYQTPSTWSISASFSLPDSAGEPLWLAYIKRLFSSQAGVTVRRPVAGFSLIELMVVIVLMAIALSIALPAMASFLHGQAVSTAAEDIYGLLQYARSEAVGRHQKVSVVAADSSSWGGAVSVQTSQDGATVMLRQQDMLASGEVSATTTSQPLSQLDFYANGSASGATVITLCFSSDDSIRGRQIEVARSGQVSAPEAVSCE